MMFGRSATRKKPRAGSTYRAASRPQGDAWSSVRIAAVGGAFAFLVVAITPRLTTPSTVREIDVDTQAVARDTIEAEFRFQTVDLEATRAAQEEAAARVPYTYRVDEGRVGQQLKVYLERVNALEGQRSALEKAIRSALLKSDGSLPPAEVARKAVVEFAQVLTKDKEFQDFTDPQLLASWLMANTAAFSAPRTGSPDKAQAGSRPASSPHKSQTGVPEGPRLVDNLSPKEFVLQFANLDRLKKVGEEALQYVLVYGVLAQADFARAFSVDPERRIEDPNRRIVIHRDTVVGDLRHSEELTGATAPLVPEARKRLAERIGKGIQDMGAGDTQAPVDWKQLEDAAFQMAEPALAETLVPDAVATESAREIARREIPAVMKWIEKERPIQYANEEWTPQSRSDYRTYLEKKRAGQEPVAALLAALGAHILLTGMVLLCLIRALALLGEQRNAPYRRLYLALLILCATVAVGRVALYFDPLGYVTPAAAGAILMAILANVRLALLTSFLTAVLLSVQYGCSWQVLVIASGMSFAGLLSIYRVRRRSDMGGAAIKATLVGLVLALMTSLAGGSVMADPLLRTMGLVALNGMICMFVVPGLLSPLERMFGITTDIQLLEFSDLNNEVLSRLAVEVPATHSHSLRVGELAEAAADAIGANGLLARVCAFYHDIGKLRRPQYFSENQTGANVHDDLSPRLSARAIESHVTEGLEMAREHHLPKPIQDGIREHHGTALISFFYQEARAQQKHGEVCEEDFRYPGPKPQSRETAILMICDAAESAARTLKNPNEERVRELVDKIINSRAADRQFDECYLTLRDLATIGDVVSRRLLSHLHRRIEYPDHPAERVLRPLERANGSAANTVSGERPVPPETTSPGVVAQTAAVQEDGAGPSEDPNGAARGAPNIVALPGRSNP